MGTAAEIITARVRDRVREEFGEEVRRYNEHALNDATPLIDDEHGMTSEVLAAVTGFGAIQPLLDDPSVEEIWINEPTKVFVARSGVSELTDVILGEGDVRDLVERMLRATGRRVDLANPFVDASLPSSSRTSPGATCRSTSASSPRGSATSVSSSPPDRSVIRPRSSCGPA
jgi:pilus assembly protein CpaF